MWKADAATCSILSVVGRREVVERVFDCITRTFVGCSRDVVVCVCNCFSLLLVNPAG